MFYNEFGSFQKAVLNTAFSGTLNNLFFDTFNLKTSRNTSVNGKLKFKNLFNSTVNSFEMDADFKSISSTYTDLKAVLPRVLGASISSSFEALGRFDIQGTAKVSKQTIETVMDIETELGAFFVDLNLDQIESLDNALYVGQVQFTDFDMGRFIKEPKMGLISSNLNVEGRGFNKETINSNIKGKFDSFTFQNYIYSDLEVSGVVKNKIFNGQLNITDPNLEFSFEGLVDFSENENIYDFSATIPHANLNALNFVKRDRISVLNGQVIMDMRGTSIDDVYGTIKFKNTLYQNQNDSYNFKDFEITSSFDASSERTIRVNSPEIVQGNLKGKFAIKEVPNLLRNAFGDIYTKYKPYQVNDSQYFNFNFTIFNHYSTFLYICYFRT